MDSVDPRGNPSSATEIIGICLPVHFSPCTLFLLFRSCSNRVNLDSSNPGTSKHPHMSNRIYEILDSEYRVHFLVCNVSWVLKRTVSTKRLFLCIQTHFCNTRTECKIRVE